MNKGDVDSGYYTIILLIFNEERDKFVVIKNAGATYENNRWALPTVYGSKHDYSPGNEVVRFARHLFKLYLWPPDVEHIFTSISREGCPVYIYSTRLYNNHIARIIDECMGSDKFYLLNVHQASLAHSGLDETHKKILIEAGLIDLEITDMRIVVSNEDDDEQEESRSRIRNFNPPPL